MKKIHSLVVALLTGAILFTGCGSKTPDYRQEKVKNFSEKINDLPKWVTEDASPFTAVGSAVYKGQSFFHVRQEAVALAKLALVQKVSAKVDAVTKTYYQSSGATPDASLEDVTKTVSSQLSSQVLNGVIVTKTYASEDGELFVQVTLNPDAFEQFLKNNYSTQKYLYQQINADKAWKELKEEVKDLPQNKVTE